MCISSVIHALKCYLRDSIFNYTLYQQAHCKFFKDQCHLRNNMHMYMHHTANHWTGYPLGRCSVKVEIEVLYHRFDEREFEWTPGVGDGRGGLPCCNSWGRKESDTTERLNWTELIPHQSSKAMLYHSLPPDGRSLSEVLVYGVNWLSLHPANLSKVLYLTVLVWIV